MKRSNLTKIAVASTAVMATLASPAIAMADETTTTDNQTKQAIAQAQDSVAQAQQSTVEANHAASTGVRSLPVLDRTCKTDPGGGVPVPGDNTPRIIDDRAGKSYRNRRPGPDHRGLPNMVMGGSRRDSPRPRKGTQ